MGAGSPYAYIAATVLIGAFYCLHSVLSASIADVAKSAKAGDDALHSRINQVRDEYVRRIEFDAQINRICDDLRGTRDEQKETNNRLDGIMAVADAGEKVKPRRGWLAVPCRGHFNGSSWRSAVESSSSSQIKCPGIGWKSTGQCGDAEAAL